MEGRSTPRLFSSIAAFKVGLDLCAYQYNTTFINGVTKTVQISRATDLKWATVEKVNANHSFNAVSSETGDNDYWMEQNTIRQFNNYLGLEIFYGSTSQGINVNVEGNVAPACDNPYTFANQLVNKSKTEGQDSLRQTMDNLAIGMTNALVVSLRSRPSPGLSHTSLLAPLYPLRLSNKDLSLRRLRYSSDENPTIPGIASEPVIYIFVNFRWLIVPILSTILSLFFLLTVIFETTRSGVPAWKASPIAALLSLDHDAGSAIAAQDHSRSLDARARELTLRLKSEGRHGWFLECDK